MPGHEDPREALIRHALDLQRVSNAVSAEHNPLIRELFDEIAALIAKIDPTAVSALRYRQGRVDKVLEEVERLTGQTFGTWHQNVRNDMARVGRAEGVRAKSDLIASLGPLADEVKASAPTQNMIKSILDTRPFQGETLRGWAEVQEAATVKRVRQQLQIGMVAEEDIGSLVRRIRGRSNGRGAFVGGVLETTTRDATAIVRTAVTDVAAQARMETFKQAPNVVQSVQWVSALDSRTCIECGGLDGTTWPLDDTSAQNPPAHINCRCSLVPVVDWEGLGLEPPDDGMRAARTPDGKRTEVPASTSYEQWLRDQPASVQNEVLGASRAQLFRDDKIRLDQLVGSDRGILTLDELERGVGVGGGGRVPDVPTFSAAKTVAEAEDWARGTVAAEVSYEGLTVETANEVNRALHDMVTVAGRAPLETVKSAQRAVGSKLADAWSSPKHAGNIKIYPPAHDAARLAAQTRRVGERAGASPPPYMYRDVYELVVHEYGHIAHGHMPKGLTHGYEILGGTSKSFEGILQGKIGAKGRRLAMQLSEYAGTDTKEFFAEAWSAYHTGRRSLIPPEVIELIEEVIEHNRTWSP